MKNFPAHFRFEWMKMSAAWASEVGPLLREHVRNEAPLGKTPAYKGQYTRYTPGKLKKSISYKREISPGVAILKITSNLPYAKAVAYGSKAHVIAAANSPFLHFKNQKTGNWVITSSVKHPGNKANDFAMRAYRGEMEAAMIESCRNNIYASLTIEE